MAKKHDDNQPEPINNASPDLEDALRSIDAIGESEEPGSDDGGRPAFSDADGDADGDNR